MGLPVLKPWGSFLSWDDVLREFARRHGGCQVMMNVPQAWLNLAEDAERRGKLKDAATYLSAGILREAYDRDTYEPPADVQAMLAPTQAEGER